MKMPWQVMVLIGLEGLNLLLSLPSLFYAFSMPTIPGAAMALAGVFFYMVFQLARLVLQCRGKKLGWGLSLGGLVVELLLLFAAFALLMAGRLPAIDHNMLLRNLLYGYLILCLPTRAYFCVGRAPTILESKRRPPGERFARFSARLGRTRAAQEEAIFPEPCNAAQPEEDAGFPIELDAPAHTETDLWLEQAGRMEQLTAASQGEGRRPETLARALLAGFPQWAQDSNDLYNLLRRTLVLAFQDLEGYGRFPRRGRGSGEITLGENDMAVTVTLTQNQPEGPCHAAGELRLNWEPES